jgi:two-component system CheB/CheR fusion protein
VSDHRQQRERELAHLLDYLNRTRGLDLSGYKRVGLLRRLTKRMRAVGVEGFGPYVDYLESHPGEYTGLLDTLLINVTAFFRDDLPWEYLRTDIVPALIARKSSTDPIRVWCAGCASGEETYTLAIVLSEVIGVEAFQERVKLYGTDLDNDALAKARLGAYTEEDLMAVPAPLVEKYFERRDRRLIFRKDLRRCVIFGRNDLMQDAPISRVDLLACRNTLMYFDGPAQAGILSRFHFALNDGGYLFLGRAETMLTEGELFAPVDLRRRVFTKAEPRDVERPRLMSRVPAGRRGRDAQELSLRLRSFDVGTTPQFVIGDTGRLLLANARARVLFRISSTDIGRPLQDLEISYRPYELRSVIEQAYADRQPVARDNVVWPGPNGEQRWFDILVTPLLDAGGASTGASVTFNEVTRVRHLQQRLDDSQTELATAYQELQNTNAELETTNEALHSTVEELETTNEELQSTNDELGTMNEELQSMNQELTTVNDELRERSETLNEVSTFLESLFSSMRSGIAVLDRDLRVQVWNRQAEELWGVRSAEVEQVHFLTLDIGLPLERTAQPIRSSLAGTLPSHEMVLQAVNRRGRAIACKTSIFPLIARGSDRPRGVIVLMEEEPMEPAMESARDRVEGQARPVSEHDAVH